jgi:2-C-methyl-D-erythritol 4-phosphate cytidylyltransferase
MIDDVLLCGREHGAAMLGVPSVVQVKVVTGNLDVERSLDREQTWLGQTPQVFDRHLLEQAYARAAADHYSRISDDADLVTKYTGHTVKIVRGSANNIKITTPMDLVVADVIATRMSS